MPRLPVMSGDEFVRADAKQLSEAHDVNQSHKQDTPVFVRWTDHLTGKSGTLRVDADDADAPLRWLVSKYLEAPDTKTAGGGTQSADR